jgi:hypothetical protein
MGFIASVGITFQILACVVPKNDSNFWPLLVYLFYILLPLPVLLSKRIIKDSMIGVSEKDTARAKHYAVFFTAGIMVSSFALPILLARSPESKPIVSIEWIQPALHTASNSNILTRYCPKSQPHHPDQTHFMCSG